jgi:hypothetical protein
MERRGYFKQICAWWQETETEADNYKINPAMFKTESQIRCEKAGNCEGKKGIDTNENCCVLKEALEKLEQFLVFSHSGKCNDPHCRFDPKDIQFKVRVKKNKAEKVKSNVTEFKIKKKRGRKSFFEKQQMEILKASNGGFKY